MKNNLFSAIILAAGSGSRMHSSLSKVLHRIGGQTMIDHLLGTLKEVNVQRVCLVTSPSMDVVRNSLSSIDHAIQVEPLGTAHAVLAAEKQIKQYGTNILILYGDVPLVTAETIKRIVDKSKHHQIVMLGMNVKDANAYGRIIASPSGEVKEVKEVTDCNQEQLQLTLCNSGILMIHQDIILNLLKKIRNDNKQTEFYLTDIIKIGREEGCSVAVVEGSLEELQGVNTQAELARAEDTFQKRKRKEFLDKGVTFLQPETVYVSHDTKIDKDVLIEPHVFIGTGVEISAGVTIRAFSHLEGSTIHSGATVGPFARLRPGTIIGEDSKVGNFVEIKKSVLGVNTKVSHLTYIGDAELGDRVNIGAGTITCNYDGYHKHKTVIKDDVFIGSNTALVAPLIIGQESMIGAGSVITQDVPAGDIGIARASQKNIRDASIRFHSKHSKNKRSKK